MELTVSNVEVLRGEVITLYPLFMQCLKVGLQIQFKF